MQNILPRKMPTSSAKSSSNSHSRFKKKIEVKCWCEDLCLVFVSRTPENPGKKFWGALIIRNSKARHDARVKLHYIAATNDGINADGCWFVRGFIVHPCSSVMQDLMAIKGVF
uniref:Uncharacterized protein n=1 Tax=Lactuca sativa TaxID=4236 RepID=A0A9R1VZ04_LACSA|nr:hypothetical protein LSAT_V11C400201890 [Lactuca sativa]